MMKLKRVSLKVVGGGGGGGSSKASSGGGEPGSLGGAGPLAGPRRLPSRDGNADSPSSAVDSDDYVSGSGGIDSPPLRGLDPELDPPPPPPSTESSDGDPSSRLHRPATPTQSNQSSASLRKNLARNWSHASSTASAASAAVARAVHMPLTTTGSSSSKNRHPTSPTTPGGRADLYGSSSSPRSPQTPQTPQSYPGHLRQASTAEDSLLAFQLPEHSPASTNAEDSLAEERTLFARASTEDGDSIMGMSAEGDVAGRDDDDGAESSVDDVDRGDVPRVPGAGGTLASGASTSAEDAEVGSSDRAAGFRGRVGTYGSVDDEEYYRQDYYVAGGVGAGGGGGEGDDDDPPEEEEVPEDLKDDLDATREAGNLDSPTKNVLDDLEAFGATARRGWTAEEYDRLTRPDTPRAKRNGDASEGGDGGASPSMQNYHDFHVDDDEGVVAESDVAESEGTFKVDAGDLLNAIEPAKQDYEGHFGRILSAPLAPSSAGAGGPRARGGGVGVGAVGGGISAGGPPPMPMDEEFNEAEARAGGRRASGATTDGGDDVEFRTFRSVLESPSKRAGEPGEQLGVASANSAKDVKPAGRTTGPGSLDRLHMLPRYEHPDRGGAGGTSPSAPGRLPRSGGAGRSLDVSERAVADPRDVAPAPPPSEASAPDVTPRPAHPMQNPMGKPKTPSSAVSEANEPSEGGEDGGLRSLDRAVRDRMPEAAARTAAEDCAPSAAAAAAARPPRDGDASLPARTSSRRDDDASSSGDVPPDADALAGASCLPPAVVAKLLRDNQKLRRRRKELLALLGNTAQQFSAYERACSEKVAALEERNRRLEGEGEGRGRARGRGAGRGDLSDSILGDAADVWEDAGPRGFDQKSGSPNKKVYDAEVVRRLSSGVLMQEKHLKARDELVAQLKLRCEVLKQSLSDQESEAARERRVWEEGGSPGKRGKNGELLEKNMKIARMGKELETALGDIGLLTSSLERNNETLDAAVAELDKMREWRKEQAESAARLAPVAEEEDPGPTHDEAKHAVAENDRLRCELRQKEEETSQLQRDLESSLDEIEDMRSQLNAAAEAGVGHAHFLDAAEDLRREAKAASEEAERATERASRLEEELEVERAETERLRAGGEPSDPDEDAAAESPEKPTDSDDGSGGDAPAEGASGPESPGDASRKGFFGRLRGSADKSADYPTMVRQRDLKIKSLEAMNRSSARIMEKLRGDIERMDVEKEEVRHSLQQRVEELEREKESSATQRTGGSEGADEAQTSRPEDVADGGAFLWDDQDQHAGERSREHEHADLLSKNLQLQRFVTELQSESSFQEDQIETIKAELVKLRVRSTQERENALAELREENNIVRAQRLALESQLADINDSARRSLAKVSQEGESPQPSGGVYGGADPVTVAQLAMLENANRVLESSVDSLRSDMQAKLAPLLEKIALLEEEKRMIEEEMETKLSCREATINNLENSLTHLQNATRRFPRKK